MGLFRKKQFIPRLTEKEKMKKLEEVKKLERKLGKMSEAQRKKFFVNILVTTLVGQLKKVDAKYNTDLAKRLEEKIKSKEIIIMSLPGQSVIKSAVVKGKGGVYETITHGLTTKYYEVDKAGRRGKLMAQVITLPEAKMFKQKEGRMVPQEEQLTTFIHELLGHATESARKMSELESEIRADLIVNLVAKEMGLKKKTIEAYNVGRPIDLVRKAEEAKAKKKKEAEKERARKAFAIRQPGFMAEKAKRVIYGETEAMLQSALIKKKGKKKQYAARL